MKKADDITSYLRAGFSAFWVTTQEPRRAVEVLTEKIEQFVRKDGGKYRIGNWNCLGGDPVKALSINGDFNVKFLMNYHWFIKKPPVVQTIQDNIEVWKNHGNAIIVVSPVMDIPIELEKDFVPLSLELPDEKAIKKSFQYISESTNGAVKVPDGTDFDKLVSASKGLTQLELENTLALSVVKKRNFDSEVISDHKASIVEKSGLLEIVKPTITFDDVCGYDQIKQFVLSTIRKPEAKGILILGPPGCGKTMFMNALVGTTGKIGLNLNFGKMFSKYQGETDQNIEAAIKVIEAIGDCIVMVDEFEKQFAGAASTGETDSGVTRRATGRWLRFMQERPKGVYIIGTCNSFRGMPPEYLRPGRWDSSPFFIDLPSQGEKMEIMAYYLGKYRLAVDGRTPRLPAMDKWTGAEIEACCRNASMMECSVADASKFVLPQAKTMEDEISELRTWSKGRTIPATIVIKKKKKKRVIDT